MSALPSSLHASDTLTRALAKRATSPRVTVNRRSARQPPPPLSTNLARAIHPRACPPPPSAGRKSDKCAELSACQICSTLRGRLSFSTPRARLPLSLRLAPSRATKFAAKPHRRSVRYDVVGRYFFFATVFPYLRSKGGIAGRDFGKGRAREFFTLQPTRCSATVVNKQR